LTSWQEAIVVTYPAAFLAGMIDSDGCRSINRVKGHAYPRYFFSNLSTDLRGLFIWACALVGVEARPANHRNVAVSRRADVAILDELIGPKH
jgi:hypothetical protein